MPEVTTITVKDASGANVDVATVTALNALIGEVQASPTANTLQDRLKTLATSLTTLLARGVAQLGARTVAQSPAVNIATDQPAIAVNQVASAYDIAASFSRPADTTAYAAGDVVGGPITFAAIGPAGAPIMLAGAQLEIDIAAIPSGMTGFRLYLYSVTPPSALADNALFDLPGGDRASFLGVVDLGSPADLGSTLYVETNTLSKQVKLSGANLYGYLVTTGGFTPSSADAIKVTLHAVAV